MRKLLSAIAIALSLWASPALAQNTTCSDRPAGDSSNACANTRFVSRSASSINTYTPEQYYQSSDGTNWGLAIDRAIQALQVLPNGGTLKLACGTTYTISTVSGNGLSAVRLYDKVNIIGCGDNSVIKIADNVNTSSAFFIYGLFRTGSLNNVLYADFTIDMNGANNSCSQTCWQQNAALGASSGNDITVRHVRMINNPGSNNTLFGSTGAPTPVTNLKLQDLIHEHNGGAVNSATVDFSSDYFYASNWTYSNITHSDSGIVGSAFEIHSAGGGTANGITVTDHFNCGIIANEATSLASVDVNLSGFKCSNVKNGLQIYSRASGTNTNINITSGIIDFLAGFSGIGIDASSVINSATGANINLNVSNVQIKSSVTTNLGNDSAGISLGRWSNAKINDNQCYNTQGPCIRVIATASGAALQFHNNQINFPGKTNNTALQAGIVVDSTAVLADNISIQGNIVGGVVRYAVIGSQNASSGYLLGNLAPFASVGLYNWTGTGMIILTLPGASVTIAGTNISQTFSALQQFGDSFFQLNGSTSGSLVLRAAAISGTSIIRFPSGSTDFSATGGTSFVLRQSSTGAPITVSQLACSDLVGAGAGCTAAAGITALTGDATATGPGSVPITFATVNANVGSFGSATQASTFTVNAKGLLTAAGNVTITPAIGSITGLAAGCATWLATPSSANLAACVTDETGTAGKVVFDTNPTFPAGITVTNNVSAGTVQNVAITNPGATATLTLGSGKTVTLSNTMTFAGTDGTTMMFPTTNATIARTDAAQTFTGTQTFGVLISNTSVSSPIHTSAGTHTFQSNGSTFAGSISTGQLWFIGSTSLTPAAGTQLTVSQNTGGTPATSTAGNILAQLIAADITIANITLDSFGAQGNFSSRFSGGTQASKTATPGGTTSFSFGGQGWDTSAYVSGAVFDFVTTATTWSTTQHGMSVRFRTTSDTASATLTERMRINQGVTIGDTIEAGAANLLVAGHILATGTVPTVSSCGVGPSISGGDNFGTVIAGTGILTSCVVNFAKTWGTAPRCVASSNTAIASLTVLATTTQLTIGGTSLTSDTINWICGSTT